MLVILGVENAKRSTVPRIPVATRLPRNTPNSPTWSGMPNRKLRYVPTIDVTTSISKPTPMSLKILLGFKREILQANKVAMKLAMAPPMMSTGPSPPKKLATKAPNASPIIAGQPKMIARGSSASAKRTWKI